MTVQDSSDDPASATPVVKNDYDRRLPQNS